MTANTTTPDTAADVDEVQRLLAEGKLRIQPLMDTDLHEGQVLNWVRVELAPGVVEPAHVHPGVEGVVGVAGRGFVQLDRADRVPLAAGTFVRIDRGTVKQLVNDGPEPLVALAVLVLDGDEPPLALAP
jgi:quercetin dioxygenase-like cupin family protein